MASLRASLSRRLRALSITPQMPTWLATGLACLCGLLTVLNQTTFDLPPAWKTSVTWALALFAFLKIGPALGPKFKAALRLPAWAATTVSVVMLAGMVIAQQNAAMPYRAIVIGVIQLLGGLGFEPAYVPTI